MRTKMMTVKELIIKLLDCDMNKKVSLEYPADKGQIIGNYSRYQETENFEIKEYMHGIIIGVEE